MPYFTLKGDQSPYRTKVAITDLIFNMPSGLAIKC